MKKSKNKVYLHADNNSRNAKVKLGNNEFSYNKRGDYGNYSASTGGKYNGVDYYLLGKANFTPDKNFVSPEVTTELYGDLGNMRVHLGKNRNEETYGDINARYNLDTHHSISGGAKLPTEFDENYDPHIGYAYKNDKHSFNLDAQKLRDDTKIRLMYNYMLGKDPRSDEVKRLKRLQK